MNSKEPKDQMIVNYWPQLSDPLILMIFSRVDSTDLVAIHNVCQQWRRISTDFTLTTRLDLNLRTTQISRDNLNLLLDLFSENLNYLKITDDKKWIGGHGRRYVNSDTNELISQLFKCHKLGRLWIENSKEDLSYALLPSKLTHLTLYGCRTHSHPFLSIDEWDPEDKYESIVYLNISYLEVFESILCAVLNRLVSLKYLYMEGVVRVNDWGINYITPPLISQLVVFDLEGTDIKDETFDYILKYGLVLEDLYLRNTQIEGKFDVTQSRAKGLKNLCLLRTKITATPVLAILKSHPSLESVYCDPEVIEVINSRKLKTTPIEGKTCLHFNSDNRFEKRV